MTLRHTSKSEPRDPSPRKDCDLIIILQNASFLHTLLPHPQGSSVTVDYNGKRCRTHTVFNKKDLGKTKYKKVQRKQNKLEQMNKKTFEETEASGIWSYSKP